MSRSEAMAERKYRWVGDHPQEFPGGRVLAVGEFIELDEDAVRESLVEDLLTQGTLIGVDEKAEHEADLAGRRVAKRDSKKEGGES
jgi:hypothetical protein